MYKLAVFVSGRGSNLSAIVSEISNGKLNAKLAAVVSNKAKSGGIEFALSKSIPTYIVGDLTEEGSISYQDLLLILMKKKIDLIVLAGFLKKIPIEFVQKFKNRIINIHPALLPSFGGKGMYGMNVHNAVFNSSAKVSGATVHFVDEIYDNGKIIYQKCVDISNVKSPEEIAKSVLTVEHQLLPAVISKFVMNKIVIKNNRVIII